MISYRTFVGLLVALAVEPTLAAQPLHQAVDKLIAGADSRYEEIASGIAGDAEFLRRVYLDLTSRVPGTIEVRAFLADQDVHKRAKLIDRLLAGPEYARRIQHWLDVMLMERRPKKHVELDAWRDYLFQAARQNKSWDVLTRELLNSDGAEPATRAAARFLLDRELKNEETTRAIGRIFLGRDLECAQCHDHPQIDDYAQRHYFGISAFLNRSYVFTDPKSKQASIGEKAEGTVTFTSVFTSEQNETPPRVLDLAAIDDPLPEENPYLAKPEKKTRGVPKYSRRLQLADALIDPQNRAFRLNIANRLWALVMGRGLVEPLDMFHTDNPASHPELLDMLADDLHEHGYDMRRTIRGIVMSQTYQRSSQFAGEELPAERTFAVGLLKPLSPEQLAGAVMQATGFADQARAKARKRLAEKQTKQETGTPVDPFRIEQLVNDSAQQHVDSFVSVFASSNQSSRFDATANQALFLLNGPLLEQWLQPVEGSLIDRLGRLATTQELAEELYLAVFSRLPTPREVARIEMFLLGYAADRDSGLKELARTMLCSAEFRFNH